MTQICNTTKDINVKLTFPFATRRKTSAKMEASVWMELERDFIASVSQAGPEKHVTLTLTNVSPSHALMVGSV